MPVLTKGLTFSNGEQLTAEKLNVLVEEASFDSSTAVDNSTTRVNASGAITVKPQGITSTELAQDAVITANIVNGNVTKAKIENVTDMTVLGNTSGSDAAPQEVGVLDEDDMSSNSATALATQQSIKAYVDGSSTQSSNGYVKMPNGVIIQWGSLTPSAYETDVTLPIAFPNNCWNVQTSIGSGFTDSRYDDNSFIWGGYPKSGDLSQITIMSNLRIENSTVTYRKIFWQAIGN
jgi:hypothetical protein